MSDTRPHPQGTDSADQATALSMQEKRQKRLEFARKKMMDPGADPPLFPRGLMLLPWLVLVIVMPLAVGIGAPTWADSERREQRRGARQQRDAAQAKRQARLDALADVNRSYDEGQGYRNNGDHSSAIEEFTTFIDSNPNHVNARWLRSLSYFELQDLDAARADLDAVIRLESTHAYAYRSRGQVRALQSDRQGAIADFVRCHELDPSNAYAAIWISGLGGGNEQLTPFASGTQWINDVARYYTGRMTEEQLLVRAERARNESERQDQLCEAYGYIGLRNELDGEHNMAMRRYRECVATGVTNFIEYRWAAIRLNQEGRRNPGSNLDLERD